MTDGYPYNKYLIITVIMTFMTFIFKIIGLWPAILKSEVWSTRVVILMIDGKSNYYHIIIG